MSAVDDGGAYLDPVEAARAYLAAVAGDGSDEALALLRLRAAVDEADVPLPPSPPETPRPGKPTAVRVRLDYETDNGVSVEVDVPRLLFDANKSQALWSLDRDVDLDRGHALDFAQHVRAVDERLTLLLVGLRFDPAQEHAFTTTIRPPEAAS